MKPLHLSWQETICTKNIYLLYVGGIWRNAYFIPVDITEGVVKFVARKILVSSVLGGTYSEALQGWIFKVGYDRKIISISVETLIKCLSNKIPPWAAYHAFMSVRLIMLYKQPGVYPFCVGETWVRLLDKCVLRVTGPKATRMCRCDQRCAGLKAVVYGAVHSVQAIWGTTLTTKG